MLTQDEYRKKRWEKELKRKEKKMRTKRGFQRGHQGYWNGKKRSEEDKEAMREGKAKSNYVFTEEHIQNLKTAKVKFWDRIKLMLRKGE